MQKLLALLFLVFAGLQSVGQSGRNWDKPMELRRCSVAIEADVFTATTFIEMEFYNPNDREVEGLYRFQLQPGQAITHFQLDLWGQYRDGSIEEKWKAANAYNTIVGKRIDPALLQMDSYNRYSLRIYPIAARSTRKVTMTVQQLLTRRPHTADYYLPFDVAYPVQAFEAQIRVRHYTAPAISSGLLKDHHFSGDQPMYQLHYTAAHIPLNQPITFQLPLNDREIVCTRKVENLRHFAVSYKPALPPVTPIAPRQLTVLWDVSASGATRDLNKEINFLKQYISYHRVNRLTLVTFRHKMADTVDFDAPYLERHWLSYLRNLHYDGATQLGSINLSKTKADLVFLFTDGRNSYGKSLPAGNSHYLFCVTASRTANKEHLERIVGQSGGKVIDLLKTEISEAVRQASHVQNVLLDIRSASGSTLIDQEIHEAASGRSLIAGTMAAEEDSLLFLYGNNQQVVATQKLYLDGRTDCAGTAIERISMLSAFDDRIKTSYWQSALLFGRENRVVTPNTSFIVLERVEDYVRFNIDPPKELEKACEEAGFVKRNSRTEGMGKARETDVLNGVATLYNNRIRKWGSNVTPIVLTPSSTRREDIAAGSRENSFVPDLPGLEGSRLEGRVAGLEEVVVVGYGSARRKALTGAVTTIHARELSSSATSVEQALEGRVAGLQVTPGSSFMPGSATVRIRGVSSVGGNEPLYIVDGVPVSGNINEVVRVPDIQSIDVLKDAAATAVYGSRAAHGVIVIHTKKGAGYYGQARQGPYRLKDQEDVDYLQEIKNVPRSEKWATYLQLQETYGSEPGFYLDMAQHLYKEGFREDALQVLSNGAEVSEGNIMVLKAMAFILEEWKEYREAIELYQHLKEAVPDDIRIWRNLALAYHMNKEPQKAIALFFEAISKDWETNESASTWMKEMMLNEMNAIIAVHGNAIDLSFVNKDMIRPLPVDLRVVLQTNTASYIDFSIVEPGGNVCRAYETNTQTSGYITHEGYHYATSEYQVKEARKGKYRIRVNYYDAYRAMNTPVYIKITTFKNFGRPDQSMQVENVVMDNQNGEVEIGELNW